MAGEAPLSGLGRWKSRLLHGLLLLFSLPVVVFISRDVLGPRWPRSPTTTFQSVLHPPETPSTPANSSAHEPSTHQETPDVGTPSSESKQQPPRLQPETITLPRPEDCVSYVVQTPSNNGLGHSHADRNNALLLALRFDPSFRLCYAYMPLGDSHHQSGSVFENFFNFSHGFPILAQVTASKSLKSVRIKATKLSKAIQEIRKRWKPQAVFWVLLEMQVNHCLSIPVWRALYWQQRRRAPVAPLPGGPCYRVVIHVRPRPFPSPKRELPAAYYAAVANAAVKLIQAASPGRGVCVFLLTAPGRFDIAALQSLVPGLRVRLNDSVAEVFHHGAAADVLVTSRSGFDHTNAMFGHRRQVRLCAPMWLRTDCDDTWVTTQEPSGHFDAAHFTTLWRFLHGSDRNAS